MATNLPTREDLLDNLQHVDIASLPDSSTGNATCQICFGDLADNARPGENERAVRLHGSHYYGEECIRHWLQSNDSCPMCREKVHKGSPRDDRLVIDLLTETTRTMQHFPTIESPIDDQSLFNLFSRLRRATETIGSASVLDILEGACMRLLRWRRDWWLRNSAYLHTGEFARYTGSRAVRDDMRYTTIVVRAPQSYLLILNRINEGYNQAIEDASLGQPRHIACHPLSFMVSRILRKQLKADNMKEMCVAELGFQLHNAVKQDLHLQDLFAGLERENLNALKSLVAFTDDVLLHVLEDLITSQ